MGFLGGRSLLGRLVALCALATVGAAGPASAAGPMSFHAVPIGDPAVCGSDCAQVIVAEGEIDNETADRFVAFLAETTRSGSNVRKVVFLQSPGGTVVGAMQLGLLFRKVGAAVVVAQVVDDPRAGRNQVAAASCMSACTYALFGGTQRVVPRESRVGIHRMFINQRQRDPSGGTMVDRTYADSDLVDTLSRYTRLMGVDPRLIAMAESVSPDGIHIVTPAELSRWHLGSQELTLPGTRKGRSRHAR